MEEASQLHGVDQAATEEVVNENNTKVNIAAEDDETSSKAGDDEEGYSEEDPQEEFRKPRDDALCRFYRPLHKAALKGDWESAERFLIDHDGNVDITHGVNRDGMSILHVAASMGHADFIRKLVRSRFFPKEALAKTDKRELTALHYAASVGSLSAVKFLVSLDDSLTQIGDFDDCIPLRSAADNKASRDVIWYLAKKTSDYPDSVAFSGPDGADLITSLVAVGYYDICLYLFNRYPNLASDSVSHWNENASYDLLSLLVCQQSQFPSGSKLSIWQMCIYYLIPIEAPVLNKSNLGVSHSQLQTSTISTRIRSKIAKLIQWIVGAYAQSLLYIVHAVPGFKHIRDEKYKHKCIIKLLDIPCQTMSNWDINEILSYFHSTYVHYFAAAEGVTEIINAFIEHFPDIMDDAYVDGQILMRAVQHRQVNVYNIMMERGITVKFLPDSIDEKTRDNILHKAARLAPYIRLSSVSSPALQMQRELQWFKEVDKFVPPPLKVMGNKEGEIPRDLFTAEHKDLVRDAERWMKETSNSCLVVATLIITIVFAAAFTIPGGNIDGTAIPLLLKRNDFVIFVASDAVGMFSSATSILMFLSILTARYAEEDFLHAIPKRLILGLASLLIAIASMMVTFGVAVYMILHPRFKWIIFPIIGLTCIPVAMFVMLQLPLFIYMVRSTYGHVLMPLKSSAR